MSATTGDLASFIIRFEGTLTQGPRAGRQHTFADSWAGLSFDTEDRVRAQLKVYQQKEPGLTYKLFRRVWRGKIRDTLFGRRPSYLHGKWEETEIPI